MMRTFFPDRHAPSVYDIPYDELKSKGYINILFDIDNTLERVSVPTPGRALVSFFNGLTEAGFSVCLLSNGRRRRVSTFAAALDVPYVCKASKPLFHGANKALALLGADKASSVIIGDQIFTDVLCGRLNKIYTVLVRPLSNEEEWFVKLKRLIEKPVLREYFKRNGSGNGNA